MDDLSIDPSQLPGRDGYFLLTGLVVPRPIAWVSTIAASGTRNIAPHSFFNVVSARPPIVQFVSSGVKDTLRNVRANSEFVVNIVGEDLLEQMNLTAADFPPDHDEFDWADLAAVPSDTVRPVRVADAKAALECSVRQILQIGDAHMVFGDIRRIHVSGEIMHEGRVDPERLRPVGRLAGSHYSIVSEIVSIPRPTYADLEQAR